MEHFLLRHLDTAIAGFFAVLLFFYLVQRRSSRHARNSTKSPPEAADGWPIIGHLHLLGGSQLPHITLGNMADKLGPIFTIRVGVNPALVISSSELAKECFTTQDSAVSSRPKYIAAEILGWNYVSFGFAPYGPFWREIRKVTVSELLSNKRLEQLRHVRESEVEHCVKNLYNLWTRIERGSDRVMVEMKNWIGDMNLNVILRVVAGKRYSGADERAEREMRRCRKAMRDFFHLTGLFLVGDAIPFLRWLDFGGYEKAMKKTQKEMESIAEGWLEEHRQRRGSGDFGGEKDFMDVMVSMLKSTDLAGYDADTVNKATCMNIIAGGSDTTTVTIVWALCLVLNNRNVLKKLQDELDLHVGKERLVKESDISNLVYLQAVVKETLRLYPAGPLSGIREFTEDCTVGGYHVAKGTRLITNLWKIQTDPRMWSHDALEFKPERFLNREHKNVDVKGKHFELIPFGSGRRLCPGATYGLQMTHLVMAGLLQAYSVFTDGQVDMTASFGLTNAKATPLNVLLKPRLSPSLYE